MKYIDKNDYRRIHVKKSPILICHCGGKYIATPTSPEECLLCYYKKIKNEVIRTETAELHTDS